MPVKTKAQLQAEAALIANETTKRANTAVRVGNTILDVVDSMGNFVDVTSYGASPTASGADNDIAIAAAIAAATAAGGELWWPAGSYASAASIASLHSVRHRGPGRITRNGDTWYVQPRTGQTNRLYVATTGSAANDGIAFGSYMATPQNAFDAMKNYGPVLDGTWKVILSAGTYAVHSQTMEVASREWVTVQGPTAGHPNVPTAIFDGSGFAANLHGFVIGVGGSPPGIAVWFQDIKCQDYNAGSNNSCGWSQGYGARCIYVNCHADNCDFAGILADQGDICLVSGGIINNCRDGVVLNATKGTVGYGSPFTLGSNTRITSCSEFGLFWSRGAQGHCDNVFFDQNARALRIESAARVHVLGTDFRRSTTAAISTNTDGSYYNDVSEVNSFNDGTGNANTKRYEHNAFTGEQQTWLGAAVSEMRMGYDDSTYASNNTAKTTVATPFTIPAYWLEGTPKNLRVKVWGTLPAIANVKVGVDLGSVEADQSTVVGTPGANDFLYEVTIFASALNVQRSFSTLNFSTGTPRIQSSSVAAPTATGLPVRVTLQVPTGSVTMLVKRIEVFTTG